MKYIKLTQNKRAIVDDEDFKRVNQHRWFYHLKYAKRGIYNPKTKNNDHQTMHAFIMGGKNIDHVNGKGLDNRKKNLRFCNQSQNLQNRNMKPSKAKFKGVKKQSNCDRYMARIGVYNKDIYLGSFKTAKEAALAYNQAALKYFGEFAKLNKI